MAVNYVKFSRGTQTSYDNALSTNSINSDTLYFITETGKNKGTLYLGTTIIARDINNFSQLEDIALGEVLNNNDLLTYDLTNKKWVNKSILEAIGIFVGAKDGIQGTNGLVPAPGENDEHLFLRGDGTWAAPETTTTISIDVDNKSIAFLDDGKTIGLNNYGKKYYAYIEATDTEPAHYEEQVVDDSHPWKSGLEPKVVLENGSLVLGWYEPNPTTIEGVNSQVSSLQTDVEEIKSILGSPAEGDNPATGIYAKADADSVYTKEETETLIAEEVAKYDHLIRKTFESISAAEEFIANEGKDNPEGYIYMISSGNTEYDKYDEYLYIEGSLEKVGAWEVDLSDYVTQETLDATQVIKTVENSEFNLIDKHLSLKEISASKITGLESSSAITALNSQISNLSNSIDSNTNKITDNFNAIQTLNSSVTNIQEALNNYVLVSKYEADMKVIEEAIKWHEI